MSSLWSLIKPRAATLRLWQAGLLVVLLLLWHALTLPGFIPPFMFDNDRQAAFFFGEPLKVAVRIWAWFVSDADIYRHLGITLAETLLAFAVGSVLGLAAGLWLALQPMASAILEPYVKALNSMPRIILAPIFGVWFGLGIGSKVALGVTLVFFIVFFFLSFFVFLPLLLSLVSFVFSCFLLFFFLPFFFPFFFF